MEELTRRGLITGLGACSTGLLPGCSDEGTAEASLSLDGYKSWSDPTAWTGGVVPGPEEEAKIEQKILLSSSVQALTVKIEPGGELMFDATATVSLSSRGNVVVKGKLTMRPNSNVEHRLTFIGPASPSGGIVESQFVGGGMEVLDTDVGLWVTDDGVVDISGTPRAGWNRTGSDPTWVGQTGLLSAPIAAGQFTNFAAYTQGNPVPTVNISGRTFTTEVLFLKRNVTIGGTDATHRAHVMFLMCNQPQTFEYVNLQFVGPRKNNAPITGRYCLHFHHCLNGVRTTVVRGVVVQDAGSRAFVPHASHGIDFEDCIAFNVKEEAYWWDPDTSAQNMINASNDIRFLHCAAFKGAFGAGAFQLSQGTGNECHDCVAVGNTQGSASAGFLWNATNNFKPSIWMFEDCVAHNNSTLGLRTWQIDDDIHIIRRFTAYGNGVQNINHGSYGNRFQFWDCDSFGASFGAQAQSQGSGYPVYKRVLMDGGGSKVAMSIGAHHTGAVHPVLVIDCTLRNWDPAKKAVYVREREDNTCAPSHPGFYHFIRTKVGPNAAELQHTDFLLECLHPGSYFAVEWADGTCFRVNADGSKTTLANFALSSQVPAEYLA